MAKEIILYEIFSRYYLTIYMLKTGCQWFILPCAFRDSIRFIPYLQDGGTPMSLNNRMNWYVKEYAKKEGEMNLNVLITLIDSLLKQQDLLVKAGDCRRQNDQVRKYHIIADYQND